MKKKKTKNRIFSFNFQNFKNSIIIAKKIKIVLIP